MTLRHVGWGAVTIAAGLTLVTLSLWVMWVWLGLMCLVGCLEVCHASAAAGPPPDHR